MTKQIPLLYLKDRLKNVLTEGIIIFFRYEASGKITKKLLFSKEIHYLTLKKYIIIPTRRLKSQSYLICKSS